MRGVLAASLLLLTTGCAEHQQRQQQASAQQTQKAVDVLNNYCAKAWADPRLASIHLDIPQNPLEATIQQLGNPTKASQQQKDALVAMDEVMAACYASRVSFLNSSASPAIGSRLAQAQSDARSVRAALWAGSITLGQYNTQVAAIMTTAKSQADQILSAEQAAAATRTAQEQQNNLLLLQTLQQANQAQRSAPSPIAPMAPVYQAPRPVYTDCSRFGNNISCTTR